MRKKDIILDAVKRHYSIPAINFESFDVLKALISGASECKTPLFTQTTQPAIEQLGLDNIVFMKNKLEKKYGVDIILHLDHGSNMDIVKKCIDAGYDSVMIDVSEESLEENIRLTKQVIVYAKKNGVIVESEIGFVGDETTVSIKSNIDLIQEYLNLVTPDLLAVAVGSSHGGRKKVKNIDFDLLGGISAHFTNYPLVLHGSSGVVNADLRKVSKYNICKINIETELRMLYREACLEYYSSNVNNIKIRDLHNYIGEKIKDFVTIKSKLFNSFGMFEN